MEKDPVGRLQEVLADRYRIDRELGRGGFATVYQVWNLRLQRAEALKVLSPRHRSDETFYRRFTQEIQLAASLEHPSITKVHDFGETGGACWYTMQLVIGETLKAALRARGPLPERELAAIAVPLLDALEYSHARGIVHRDIKPENVILDRAGHPFLMDFGIAKSATSTVKTQAGFLVGTPSYVAPEQALGRPVNGRADLYALGVTLFRAASGRLPFEAGDPLRALILRLTDPPRPLSEVREGVDPAFASIVMRALERSPSRRWESARAMREAFEAWLAGRPLEATGTEGRGPDALREATDSDELLPDATVLGSFTLLPEAASTETAPSAPSNPGPPERRSHVVPMVAGLLALLLGAAGAGLLAVRGCRAAAGKTQARALSPDAARS